MDSLAVSVDSVDRDALAYHLTQNGNENGSFYASYVPPGHYMVQTYIEPNIETGKIPAVLAPEAHGETGSRYPVSIRNCAPAEIAGLVNRPKSTSPVMRASLTSGCKPV